MSSELRAGQYLIRNGESRAGRRLREDRSLRPKPVFCPTDSTGVPWIVEALPNGHYILKTGADPTAEHDGHVYALLMEQERRTEWIITLRPHQDNRYTIQEASGKGWKANTDGEGIQQIAVGPLPTTKSIPPQYFGNALWTFERLLD